MHLTGSTSNHFYTPRITCSIYADDSDLVMIICLCIMNYYFGEYELVNITDDMNKRKTSKIINTLLAVSIAVRTLLHLDVKITFIIRLCVVRQP